VTLSNADYEYLRILLRQHSSNRLDDGKDYLISSRLEPVARAHGFASIPALLAVARRGASEVIVDIVEAMTINETSFFRDAPMFATLRSEIVPELLTESATPLRMWSAASASGQEAYSLAMMMTDDFPRAPAPRILATDINTNVLGRAKAGSFSQLEVNRGLPARALVRHFTQSGRDWVISDELRRMVTFRQLNLAREWPVLEHMHVILLRNVLIYFDQATRQRVFERAVATLAPGGYLILGSAESAPAAQRPEPAARRLLGRTLCFQKLRRET
jgi:chemotaxis protein methyltransferase CheR